ncbi:glycoside hydrolase [Bosea sp. WAO]|uniref:glycoside hydrolase n=1 Tax=Bosea sp. WAO TaxID=406341 RepID=UPI00074A14B8|nr:glycoside hydrolase [Bosea sp. WAO]KUL94188.1 glycoside hydrolase [Bosea sp. WAO]
MKKWLCSMMAALALGAVTSRAIATETWLPVREVSLEIRPGSPLDFSGMLPNRPIGTRAGSGASQGIIVRQDGRLAFADAPGEPARLFCASLAWSPASGGFPDRAGADRYARQLALHGYNIARLTFLDASLMHGRARDFDFDPETLDRVHYLLAALKRNGIYWIIDGMTSWRGAYGGHAERWDPGGNLKLALHLDDAAFAHWKQIAEKILARVNPYTGIAPIHDEALALVILANENGLEFESVVQDRPGKAPYDAMFAAPFNAWLAKRYASSEALAKAWGRLGWGEKLENGTIRLPANRYAPNPRLRDLQAYFAEVEAASAKRMSEALRDLGYKGLISTYNNWPTVQTALSRRGLDVVTMNTYHDWASGYAPGSKLLQQSSLGDAANAMRMAAAARWLGKPFVISEYDHLFWNRYRYEAGLVFPAYAALQGWDALCRHAHGPIALSYGEPYPHKRAMLPYAIALDPVARAGETLTALLYRRGDVSASRLTIPFAVRGEEDLGPNMQAREPEKLTELALLGRIGLEAADRIGEGIAVTQPRDANRPEAIVEKLRASRLLPAENETKLAAGLFQSDTGEILLNRRDRQMRLTTPASEAVAFSESSLPVSFKTLSVEGAQGDGLIAISSLDKPASLARGSRFLLVFATDARNTGMIFRDRDEKVIEDFGRLPVLIRKGHVDIRLARSARQWQLSPIGLDGSVKPPAVSGSGPVAFRLSNDLPTGPTTYFLLELKEARP